MRKFKIFPFIIIILILIYSIVLRNAIDGHQPRVHLYTEYSPDEKSLIQIYEVKIKPSEENFYSLQLECINKNGTEYLTTTVDSETKEQIEIKKIEVHWEEKGAARIDIGDLLSIDFQCKTK